jgi:adenylate cyclase
LAEQKRRLVAILAADAAGYSRLMAANEADTLACLKQIRTGIMEPAIARLGGRVVGSAGDSLLVEFASALSAVECAVEMQDRLGTFNADLPADSRMEFRIGVNLGDVIAEDGTIYGDGVNVAARIEKLAAPGSVCVSRSVHDQIRGKLPFALSDLGERRVHNIPDPVHVYRVEWAKAAAGPVVAFPGASPLPLPDKPSIAVLPFQNMSGDKEQDFFSDGISEDIITALSKLPWLFVIARNSTFAYKGKSPDVRQVGRELGVHYVLEGSVRKAGERIRITAQLIDGTSGAHVWAERYDRAITDIFAVQDEITQSVVWALEPQLYAAENLRLQKRPTESLDAWGCVVRAMPAVWAWVAHSNDYALRLLKRAIEIDPEYARATILLGWIYAARAHLGIVEPAPMLETALTLAQRGIDQDNIDPWAHLVVGYVHMVARRSDPAEEALRVALDLNPSFALAHMILASTLGYGGKGEEGLRECAIAMRLSPRDHIQAANLSTMGTCHFVAGRLSEAVEFHRRAVQVKPDFGTAWRSLAAVAGLTGDQPLAGSALTQALRLQPGLTLDWAERYHPIVRPEHRSVYVEGLRRAGLR